jgi:SAM-dependent methyltransferase
MKLDTYQLEHTARLYSEAKDIHASLPSSAHYWTNKYVSEVLLSLWGVRDVEGFYVKCIGELCAAEPQRLIRIVSLGCGEANIEVETCRRLNDQGYHNVAFDASDIAHGAIERAREHAVNAAVSRSFSFHVAASETLLTDSADVVIANQMLHHVTDLEDLFASVRDSIGQRGIFLSSDMIGRNGHMLWPEALAIVDRMWPLLPDKYKYNKCLNRFESQYSNWDNSKEANEGIRAQDVLPELLKHFQFERFYAAGNLAIALFGRHFGYNFKPDDEEDRSIIDAISQLDHILIDFGYLKPVLMYASMSNRGRKPEYFRHWSAEFCARREDPVAKFYIERRYELGEKVEFSERMPAIEWLGSGWSSAEVGGVWSNASHSDVTLPLRTSLAHITVTVHIFAMQYQPEGVENIPMTVTINDQRFSNIRFPGHLIGPSTISLPVYISDDVNELLIRFDYPKTWSALELGLAADARRLALRLITICVAPCGSSSPTSTSCGSR